MALTIDTINVKDSIGTLRTKINNNFSAVKDEVDDIQVIVDTSNSNVISKNLTLEKGARATSIEIMKIEASGRVKGNFVVEGDTTLNDTDLANGKTLNVNSGNVNIKGAASKLDVEGDATFKRNIIHKDFADSALDAANTGTFISVTSNVGKLDVNGKHALIFDFSNYSSSSNASNTHDVKDIELIQGNYQGQRLDIIVNSNSSSGKPHRIANANIATLASGEHIQFSKDNCVASFVFVGSSWKVTNLFNANIG